MPTADWPPYIPTLYINNEIGLRGGKTFDPVNYVKEVSHVKHMHADSLLIHPNFSSKLMIT